MSQDLLEDVVDFFLKAMRRSEAARNKEAIVRLIVDVVQSDNYKNVLDFEWVVVTVLPQLISSTQDVENSQLISSLLQVLIAPLGRWRLGEGGKRRRRREEKEGKDDGGQ